MVLWPRVPLGDLHSSPWRSGLGTLIVADDGDDDKNGDHVGYSNKPGLVGMARVSEFCLEGMQYGAPNS